jgi:hypothetical protein
MDLHVRTCEANRFATWHQRAFAIDLNCLGQSDSNFVPEKSIAYAIHAGAGASMVIDLFSTG